MGKIVWMSATVLMALLMPSSAFALDAALEHGVAATVRIDADCSGAIVDPTGIVLTTFHCVGRHNHRTVDTSTDIGALWAPEFLVERTSSVEDPVSESYFAVVVRASPELDLALLRIVKDGDGHPVSALNLPSLAYGATPNAGASLSVVGFSSGSALINISPGAVTGYELNASGERSWLRTSAPTAGGNSGGPVLNAAGELVGIHCAAYEKFALERPASRVPAEWRGGSALGASAISVQIPKLANAGVVASSSVGEQLAFGDTQEWFFFALPPQRAGTVSFARLEAKGGDTVKLYLLDQDKQYERGKPENPHPSGSPLDIPATSPQRAVVAVCVTRLRGHTPRRVEFDLSFSPSNVQPAAVPNQPPAPPPAPAGPPPSPAPPPAPAKPSQVATRP
jgi:hypothetical protein